MTSGMIGPSILVTKEITNQRVVVARSPREDSNQPHRLSGYLHARRGRGDADY